MTPDERKLFLAALDREILNFETWFRSTGEQPLARFEKAILKTFLASRQLGLFPSALAGLQTSSGEDFLEDDPISSLIG